MHSSDKKPIVYSCSGSSSAAQMSNYLAIQLDRQGVAEMSCIAGVGGDVKKLVKTAKAATQIIAIDGCPLACAKACLSRHNLEPDIHYQLGSEGVSKKQHEDFDMNEAKAVFEIIKENIKHKL